MNGVPSTDDIIDSVFLRGILRRLLQPLVSSNSSIMFDLLPAADIGVMRLEVLKHDECLRLWAVLRCCPALPAAFTAAVDGMIATNVYEHLDFPPAPLSPDDVAVGEFASCMLLWLLLSTSDHLAEMVVSSNQYGA